jgi:prepilin peptidase CpaA
MLQLGFKSVYVACICYAIVSDFRNLIIPNWIIMILISAFAVFAGIYLEPGSILAHVAVAAIALLFFSAFFVAGWMAGGDVKLIAAIALWMGPENAAQLVLLTALLGSLLALALLQMKKYGDRVTSSALGNNWLFQRARALAEQGQCPYGVAIGAAALLLCTGAFR